MNKFFYALLVLVFFFQGGIAQETGLQYRHDVSLNLLNALISSAEVSYENFQNDFSSVVVEAGVGYARPVWDFNTLAFVNSGYRIYFSKDEDKGFFIEASNRLSYNRWFTTEWMSGNEYEMKKEYRLLWGPGLGIGGKFIDGHGFAGTIKAGGGRNILSRELKSIFMERFIFSGLFWPDVEISIGKRF